MAEMWSRDLEEVDVLVAGELVAMLVVVVTVVVVNDERLESEGSWNIEL